MNIEKSTKALFRNRLAMGLSLALAAAGAVSAAPLQHGTEWAATNTRAIDLSRAAVGGLVEDSYPISIVVNLKLRNENAMDSFIGELHRPGSPAFHQFLSSEQATESFSASAEQAQAVAGYLTSQGFTNVQIAPNRLLVSADGNAAAARRAFNTDFVHLSLDGEDGIANIRGAQVPASIADQVQSVLGLQTVQKMHTAHVLAKGTATAGLPAGHNAGSSNYLPTEFQTVYHAGTTPTGSNTAVAILGWGDMSGAAKDLAQYESDAGLTKTVTSMVKVGASTTDTSGEVEWALDGQAIIGTSGGVKSITYYEADNTPTDAALASVVNRVVTDNSAKVINMSFGECEIGTNGTGTTGPYDTYFKTGVTQGQVFSASSGDNGAYPCNANGSAPANGSYGDTLGVGYPASSPYVVAVGGTTLKSTASDAYTSESAWADGGGGISSYEAKPSWQSSLSGNYRQVPDIAFDADPNSGMSFYTSELQQNGQTYPAGYYATGGTSLASPLFVGAWARLESANNNGLGFANPGLYAFSGTFPFHDVIAGKNGYYSAVAGYDNATGWGSFDIQDAAVFITDNPGFVTDTNGKGGGGSTGGTPTANFSFTTSGLTANFTDSSTDSGGTISAYSWTFGDNTTSTTQNPSHTYSAAGTYSVTETVTDKVSGKTNSKTESVTVTAPATGGTPMASFTDTTNGLTAIFTDTSTDSGGTISAHSWTFGDGGTSTAANPSHSYAKAGTYSVTETVTDSVNGKTNSATKSVTVTAPATGGTPTASFTDTTNGLTTTFTDTSTDSGGTISAHSWTFGDGSTSTATSPSHTYAKAGTYNVTETVTDGVSGKTSSATKSVTVTAASGGGGVWKGSVSNISGSAGQYDYYSVPIPAGATNLTITTSGGGANQYAWLFVSNGSEPTWYNYGYESENFGTSQSITIAKPTAGTYYIGIWGLTSFSGVNLTVTYNQP